MIRYYVNINYTKYKLDLDRTSTDSSNQIIKNTDIFTWALFKKNAHRLIWINNTENRIGI